MSNDTVDYVRDIVKKAVQKELGAEPQDLTLTSRRMTLAKSFPVTASVKMPDNRMIEVALMIQGNSYTDFKVTRESPKGSA